MTKQELIRAIKENLPDGSTATLAQIGAIVDSFCGVVIDQVAADNQVTLVGFGTFEKRIRQARNGRNPATGESLVIPEISRPVFSAGKTFKEKVKSV